VEQINQQVGMALRQLRQQQGWSLDQAAQTCGVSKAMLGQIERGESSPTVVTLWKIATGFHVPFTYFMQTPSRHELGEDLGALYRGPQPGQSQCLAEGIRVTTLLPFEPVLGYELLWVELPVGCDYYSVPHEVGSIEQVIPLSGHMALWLNDNWHPLVAGEVLRFAGDQRHGYRNLGSEPACFHDLIHYSAAGPVVHSLAMDGE
jgi:XRE family transcriptional regulator, regulator of sulfur utilization